MTGPLAGRPGSGNGSRKEATYVNANGVSIARAPFGVARTRTEEKRWREGVRERSGVLSGPSGVGWTWI